MPSSPIRSRSRSRSPVTPPHSRHDRGPANEDDDEYRGGRSERAREASDELDFDWRQVLITALEENSYSESSLSQETWDSLAGVPTDVACNVVKRVSESNLRNVRNLDGFTRSILRRIEETGIDVGTADLNTLDRDVTDAIMQHVDDRSVNKSDFLTAQVVNALKEMSVRDAIEAVDQFAKSNMDHVRNRTGFFMSIIRRVKDEANGHYRDRGGRGDRYDRYNDRYDRGGDRFGGRDRYNRGDRYGGDRYDRGDRYGGDRYDRYGGHRDRGGARYGRDRSPGRY